MIERIGRRAALATMALTLALGLGVATGGPAEAAYTKAQQCATLAKNMAVWNDMYWDAVIDKRPEDAAEARESYYLNKHNYDALGCGGTAQ